MVIQHLSRLSLSGFLVFWFSGFSGFSFLPRTSSFRLRMVCEKTAGKRPEDVQAVLNNGIMLHKLAASPLSRWVFP